MATFSRHTCLPIFIGTTADLNDILVSLSQNLNRFFSRTFSVDAHSFGFKKTKNTADKCLIPSSSLRTQCRRYPSQGMNSAVSRTHHRPGYAPSSVFLPSPTRNNFVHGVCESFPARSHVCSRRNTENVARPRDSSRRTTPLSLPSWQHAHFSSMVDFLFHLLCILVTIFVDILLPSVPTYRSGCISFSVSISSSTSARNFCVMGAVTGFDGFPKPRRSLSFEIFFHADASTSQTSSSSKTKSLLSSSVRIFPHRPDRQCELFFFNLTLLFRLLRHF